EEEENGDEEEEVEEELEEEAEEDVVDFGDMINGTENNTGINFFKHDANKTERNEHKSLQENIIDGQGNNQAVQQNQADSAFDQDKLTESQIRNKVDLLDLDLESMPKEDLINLLLKADEPPEDKKDKKKKFKL